MREIHQVPPTAMLMPRFYALESMYGACNVPCMITAKCIKIYYSQKLITQKYFLIEDTLKLFPKPAVIIDDLLGAPWKGEGVTVFTV